MLEGFGGGSTITTGAVVYPLPAISTTMAATLSPAMIAFALAPLPPPPVRVTTGSTVYPDPPEVTVIAVTNPAVTLARAVAGSPALSKPQKKAITVAVLKIQPGNLMGEPYHRGLIARKSD
jgi:hypothetical protein